ncbi:MAG: HXXEE domain-containing protein [Coriobacteriales bacterium]|jgi:hypothetical protein
MMKWMEDNWAKAVPFLAVYMGILLFLFVFGQDLALFLIWIQMVVYLLHQTEEYLLPGGFMKFFNHKMLGSSEDAWPLTKRVSFLINVPVIFLAYPVTAVLATFFGYSIGMWLMYFSIINALSHVVMALRFREYNPGTVVSACLNIPVGLYSVWFFAANGLVGMGAHIVGLIIALAVQGIVMVWGFRFMKPSVAERYGE